MASLVKMMEKLQYNTPLKGLASLGLETGIGAGASYAIGRAYSQHGDKFWGKRAAHLAAGVGKIGAAVVILRRPRNPLGTSSSAGQPGFSL